jgi:hypothetical protein
MTEVTEVEIKETLFNIGKLAGRISSDEGKRLLMLMETVVGYMNQLEKKLEQDDFDMDGRC